MRYHYEHFTAGQSHVPAADVSLPSGRSLGEGGWPETRDLRLNRRKIVVGDRLFHATILPYKGSRSTRKIRTYANLLVGGLWHGARWNFVIWGGYQGAALAIERMAWGRNVKQGLVRIRWGHPALCSLRYGIGMPGFRATSTMDKARRIL
jgi:hypothetical protein